MSWRRRLLETLIGFAIFVCLPVFVLVLLFRALCGQKVGKGGVLIALLPLWLLAALVVWMAIHEPNARGALLLWAVVSAALLTLLVVILPWATEIAVICYRRIFHWSAERDAK